jgi:5-formyltetrahydrofolate cyclo-ligase
MVKAEVRELYRNKRAALTAEERVKMDDLMLIQFQQLDIPFLQTILSYWPILENHEPNTHLFTEFLRFRNPELRIAYPVSDFSTVSMQAIATDIDTGFVKKQLNIFEPLHGDPVPVEDIDLVLVPLLIVDLRGIRVGYGQGFYDKYLSKCNEECIKIGLSYFEPIEVIDDCHEFDIPLNLCITPQNSYVF